VLHQKSECIAAFAAAKAVKKLLDGADRKRRLLFIVKGTQADKVRPRFFQGHVAPHHFHDVSAAQ
jgi:hypothetical protein